MTEKDNKLDITPAATVEKLTEILALTVSAAPWWIAAPMAQIIGGVATNLKIERVTEFVKRVAARVDKVHSEMAEEFVKTEDFIDIFEKTAQAVANERRDGKRVLFSRYIINNIADPNIGYDVRLKVLRTIEQIDTRHVDLLRALLTNPTQSEAEMMIGSASGTIMRRAPHLKAQLDVVIHETNTLGLTNIEKRSLNTTSTGAGAADLHHFVTDLGQVMMKFLAGESA